MRDFIIAIFSPLLQLNVVVSTIGGFVIGGIIGGVPGSMFGEPGFNMMMALIVGALAFVNSALVSGMGLALDRIRELMEEQVNLARVERTRQPSTQERLVSQTEAPRPATGSSMRVCPNCGARIYNNSINCPECGERLRPSAS